VLSAPQGEPIQQAAEAALFFVKDLPLNQGVRFNIVAFGSSHTLMAPQCLLYNESTQQKAVQWIGQRLQADMGGTEILGVFQAIQKVAVTPGACAQYIAMVLEMHST
jgi:von Willebrand factor type A domain